MGPKPGSKVNRFAWHSFAAGGPYCIIFLFFFLSISSPIGRLVGISHYDSYTGSKNCQVGSLWHQKTSLQPWEFSMVVTFGFKYGRLKGEGGSKKIWTEKPNRIFQGKVFFPISSYLLVTVACFFFTLRNCWPTNFESMYHLSVCVSVCLCVTILERGVRGVVRSVYFGEGVSPV
jgi:hypothetical protein